MKEQYRTTKKMVVAGIIAMVIFSSACTAGKPTESGSDSTSISEQETTTPPETVLLFETSMSIPDESINYVFKWTDIENRELDELVQEKYGLPLNKYIAVYGFTNELQTDFTQIVNKQFGTNYDLVPFSEAKYFRGYISRHDSSLTNLYHDNYEKFVEHYLDRDMCVDSVFVNKLIMSYIVNNNIPFGSRIPIENLKSFYGEDVYVENYYSYIRENKGLGLFDSDPNYEYSKDDLFHLLMLYNDSIGNICYTEGIPTRSLFYGDPEYQDKCDAAIEMYNGYLVEYFGENAWQIGEVPTREQYIAIFGEEPIDTTLITTPAELD